MDGAKQNVANSTATAAKIQNTRVLSETYIEFLNRIFDILSYDGAGKIK